MKRVAVLGSTGSIGRSTLDVIARHPDRLRLVGIAARSQTDRVAEQIAQFHPALVAVWDEASAQALSSRIGQRVPSGADGLLELATHPDVDVVVVATSGRDALLPLMHAIRARKQIALASKELLVMAGELIMRLAREHGATLIPIDSEHAALFQCLQGIAKDRVSRLVITGSGGPLWGVPEPLRMEASREQVLAHPKWQMGPKITVDSATLMNKGLEIIEARWLFDMPLSRLAVVIHPEAAVHGLIELVDGTILAQLSPCDMRLPIQYALSFPERWESPVAPLALTRLGSLHFIEPDLEQFPCLKLALEAAAAGGSACVALNGANDTAVAAYLEGQAAFGEIPRIIAEVLEQHEPTQHPTLEEILSLDEWARKTAQEIVKRQCLLR